MKHNLELLIADIKDELKKLDQLVNEFSEHSARLIEPDLSNYDRAAIGYYLHSFYNGCENSFRSIARFFENDIRAETWHSDLLKRMKLEIEGYRPAVIDQELYRLLEEFRGFRHIFRHGYSFELDWEKESLVAKKLPKTHSMLKEQIEQFITELKKLSIP